MLIYIDLRPRSERMFRQAGGNHSRGFRCGSAQPESRGFAGRHSRLNLARERSEQLALTKEGKVTLWTVGPRLQRVSNYDQGVNAHIF